MNRQDNTALKNRILNLGLHKFEEEALYDQIRQAINRSPARPRRRKEKSPVHLPRLASKG